MMTQIYKTILLFAVVAALASAPLSVFAKNPEQCEKIVSNHSSAAMKLEKHKPWKNGMTRGISAQIEARLSQIEKERASIRSSAKGKLSNSFYALRKSVSSEEDKKAVERFIATMTLAGNKRTEAINAANAEYNTLLKEKIASFENQQKSAFGAFESEVNSAFISAKTACSGSTFIPIIRANLQSRVKAAHQQFTSSTSPQSLESSLSQIRQVRLSKIEEAQKTFLASQEKALQELRTALGN